jgi:hypothetical protein
MTVKSISGIHKFVINSSDDKTAGVLLAAPAGSIAYEFTTGSPDTVAEWISYGGGVWGRRRMGVESNTA